MGRASAGNKLVQAVSFLQQAQGFNEHQAVAVAVLV